MKITKRAFAGFTDCYQLTEGDKELIVVAEVGPRILSASVGKSGNILFVDEERTIKLESENWYIYGGHRLWISPETVACYKSDNAPCEVSTTDDGIEFSTKNEKNGITNVVAIRTKNGNFIVTHTLRNSGEFLYQGAIWALTCVRPEGTVFIPWGSGGAWDTKKIIYWNSWADHGSDVQSGQYVPTKDLFLIKPTGEEGKVGTGGEEGFIGVTTDKYTFIKSFDRIPTNTYPDDNCAIEAYTCEHFIELETLSPMTILRPGSHLTHTETWTLTEKQVDPEDGEAVRALLRGLA